MANSFEPVEALSKQELGQITELRVKDPDSILEEASKRVQRSQLCPQGRLVILAADHPGRGVTAAAGNPQAMSDRHGYLARIIRVLEQPGVDGLMATPDILEELLLINRIRRRRGAPDLLAERVVIGCLNRGGLAGASFEMRDRFGSFTPAQLVRMKFDGAKMMFRLDPENPDSGRTIQDCAEALRELDQLNLPAFLEPLPVRFEGGSYRVQKTVADLSRVVGIATALGYSSRHLWLKIPYVEGYAQVAGATTCPILMLGGPSRPSPREVLQDFAAGLAAAGNVRGLLVGRNVLFPGRGEDPAVMARALAGLVHE